MIMKRIAVATSLAACLFAAACGGEDGPAAAPEIAYEDMNFEQRHAFMSEVVLPQMRETFAAFDPKFEAMSCVTCHGGGANDGSFAMPTPDLPVLPATEEAFLEYVKDPEHARWSQFMIDEVWPQMADLLEVPVFDPETNPNGFSCHSCHRVEGEL